MAASFMVNPIKNAQHSPHGALKCFQAVIFEGLFDPVLDFLGQRPPCCCCGLTEFFANFLPNPNPNIRPSRAHGTCFQLLR